MAERDTYEKLIAIEIDGEWIAVENPTQSLALLRDRWPDKTGPSYRRALSSCEAFLDGMGTILGARATFAVAAMEAGMHFALFDDLLAYTDWQIAQVAADAVKEGLDEAFNLTIAPADKSSNS